MAQPLRRTALPPNRGRVARPFTQRPLGSMGAARGGLVSPLPDYNLPIDEHVDKTILPHIVTHDLIVATQWELLVDLQAGLKKEADKLSEDDWMFSRPN